MTAGDQSRRQYKDRMDPAMVSVYQAKSPEERLRIADGIWKSAHAMLTNLIAAEHPDWTADAVRRAVASRMSHGAV
jgi:hypothetical protein